MQQPIRNPPAHVFNALVSSSVLLYPAHNPVLEEPIPEFPIIKDLIVGGVSFSQFYVPAQSWQAAAQQRLHLIKANKKWAAIVSC